MASVIMTVFVFSVARVVAAWTKIDFEDIMLGGLTFYVFMLALRIADLRRK